MIEMKATVFRLRGKWYDDTSINLPDDIEQSRAAYKEEIQKELDGRYSEMILIGEFKNEVPFLITLD